MNADQHPVVADVSLFGVAAAATNMYDYTPPIVWWVILKKKKKMSSAEKCSQFVI